MSSLPQRWSGRTERPALLRVWLPALLLAFPFCIGIGRPRMHRADLAPASDPFAQSALDTLVGSLQQEIAQGSTAATVSGGATVYQPLSPLYMLPVRSGNPAATGSPAVDPIPNLIRRSVRSDAIAAPGVPSLASAVNSASDAPLNGSVVNPARWNLHYLIPRFDADAGASAPDDAAQFTAPDWVLVSRNGAAVQTDIGTGATALNNPDPANSNYIVGRYAFAMYDEGGLLDINAAGYPTGITATQVGWKGLLPLADLTRLPVVKQPSAAADYLSQASVDHLVGWRNYASAQPSGVFPNSTFDPASAARYYNAVRTNRNGFLAVDPSVQFNGQTDQRFTSRQQLIGLCDALGISRNALQYLTTFCRALEQPSYVPAHIQFPTTAPSINTVASTAPPAQGAADSYLGNNDAAGSSGGVAGQDLINPAFLNVRVQSAFTRQDGSTAVVGEPLVKRRFALSRLGEISYNATDATPSLTDPAATQNHIKDWFGLSRTSASAPWTYYHGANHIMILSEVAAAGREPDFAELLKAAINVGSLAKGGPNLHNNQGNDQYVLDTTVDYQVLQIVANLIDQNDTDSYPTAIQLAASNVTRTVRGIEDLPYFYRYHGMTVVTRLPNPLLASSNKVQWRTGPPPTANGTAGSLVQTTSDCAPGDSLTDAGEAVLMYVPEVWNPHDASPIQAGSGGIRPARFRMAVITDDPAGQTPIWNTGTVAKVNSDWYNYIPPDYPSYNPAYSCIPKVYKPLATESATAFTFSDDNGKLFREPTLLWRTDAPTRSALQPDSNSLAGPYIDANTGVSYIGVQIGKTPVSYVGNVDPNHFYGTLSGQSPSVPASASGNYIFQAGNLQSIQQLPAGANAQYTYRLQYLDPNGSGTWITYDEKYPDFHGLYRPNLIVNKADYTNNGWMNPYSSGQLNDSSAGFDPRSARFGVGTEANIDESGAASFLEPGGATGYKGGSASSNLTFANARPTVMVSQRPGSDRGSHTNYSNPAGSSDPGKNVQMRWFSGVGYNATNGQTSSPLAYNGLFTQNDPRQYLLSSRGTSTQVKLYYEDPDGMARRAMGAYSYQTTTLPSIYTSSNLEGLPAATANTYSNNGVSTGIYGVGMPSAQSQSRPLVLNRPFQSVAEMGYAFSGTTWKNLDFFTPESGDGALLDTFCLTEPPASALVGGKVNLNTRQAPVLQAILAGAYRDETSNFTSAPTYALPALSSAEATSAASKLLAITTDTAAAWRGPLVNPAHLVGRFIPTPGDTTGATDLYQFTETVTNTTYTYAGLSAALDGSVYTASPTVSSKIQRMRESAIRPLADCGQTRVWNILIDLVAQTGNYPASATNLSQFQVAQENHYWLHVALDRFTGQVLDESIEQVFEALTDLSLSSATVPEKQVAGTTVGTIQPIGGNAGDSLTYSLVSGDGSTNNAAFTVSGNTLQTAAAFNYLAKSSYSVRLRAFNQYGQSFEKALTVTVSPSPYTQWKLAYFGDSVRDASVAGDLSDPDSDGIVNSVEYGLGLSPTQANASGVSVNLNNGALTMNYSRSSTASDVTIHAMISQNLTDPNAWTRNGVTETMLSDDGTIQRWQATTPVTGSQPVFMRLRAAYP